MKYFPNLSIIIVIIKTKNNQRLLEQSLKT